MSHSQRPSLHFIRRLCGNLSEAQIAEAEERFWHYLDIVRDIARRQLRKKDDQDADISDPNGFDRSQQ